MAKQKLSVLVVDDNRKFVERINSLLKAVTEIEKIDFAFDFDEARGSLNIQVPDVVLLDINLHGKSGIELLQIIKRSVSDCKVIMITNQVDGYYREQCRELGADYFLDKTNEFSIIPEIIRSLC